MEKIRIENLSFSYPQSERESLKNINFNVEQGEFIVICGKSGCGKTTLLRQLKAEITPKGKSIGNVLFDGKNIKDISTFELSSKIGFVMQNPENQIVTDKVWHELSFGLENLGIDEEQMHLNVAETASYFGIGEWFDKKVNELSGGQKQIMNLASVMAMHPQILLLDEPTSQLDPIATENFLKMVDKINKELGVTVIMTEHELEEVFCLADRIIVMQNGELICDASPENIAENIASQTDFVKLSVPTAVKVFCHANVKNSRCPITVREGRKWLKNNYSDKQIVFESRSIDNRKIIELKNIYFRYSKSDKDILKNLSLDIFASEFVAITGGNGAGKTTLSLLIAGIRKPYSGKIKINSKPIEKYKPNKLYSENIAVLPQDVCALFTQNCVKDDLKEISKDIDEIVKLTDIEDVLSLHPFDLSGGEQQRVALAKVLLKNPKILILDEPTKGMDNEFKIKFVDILNSVKKSGCTIVMISHDIEFCAQYADRCAMLFDGKITACEETRKFFSANHFYTTSACRMSRGIIDGAVTEKDIIKCLKK